MLFLKGGNVPQKNQQNEQNEQNAGFVQFLFPHRMDKTNKMNKTRDLVLMGILYILVRDNSSLRYSNSG